MQAVKAASMENKRPSFAVPNQNGTRTPIEIVSLIKRCWAENPMERPNFRVIVEELEPIYLKYQDLVDKSGSAAGGCCSVM